MTTIAWLLEGLFAGKSRKAVEAIVARAIHIGLVRSQPFVGNSCAYSLTPKGAASVGRHGPCYKKPLGPQAIRARALFGAHCEQTGIELMSAHEFVRNFAEHAEISGTLNCYFVNTEPEQARLTMLVPDLGGDTARKARRLIDQRRKHAPFRRMMFHNPPAFSARVLVPFLEKSNRIREALETEKCFHEVIHVPGLESLFAFGADRP